MRKWLTEPLLHFIVVGVLLFAGSSLIDRNTAPAAGRIIISQGRIANLSMAFAKVWQRPPSADELDGLIRDYVREEVLSREAIAMGLDRDDTVIRRRLQQKLEFVTNDVVELAAPSEADLQQYLDQHPEQFRLDTLLSFRQVFLSRQVRGDALPADAIKVLADLQQAGPASDTSTLGDPTMLSPELTKTRTSEVAAMFGDGFARQLASLPLNRWQGPVASAYGEHLVLVTAREGGVVPALAEVHAQVVREWTNAHQVAANQDFYQKLLRRYTVTVEPRPQSNTVETRPTPTQR